jgi:hypothetical protein
MAVCQATVVAPDAFLFAAAVWACSRDTLEWQLDCMDFIVRQCLCHVSNQRVWHAPTHNAVGGWSCRRSCIVAPLQDHPRWCIHMKEW